MKALSQEPGLQYIYLAHKNTDIAIGRGILHRIEQVNQGFVYGGGGIFIGGCRSLLSERQKPLNYLPVLLNLGALVPVVLDVSELK